MSTPQPTPPDLLAAAISYRDAHTAHVEAVAEAEAAFPGRKWPAAAERQKATQAVLDAARAALHSAAVALPDAAPPSTDPDLEGYLPCPEHGVHSSPSKPCYVCGWVPGPEWSPGDPI